MAEKAHTWTQGAPCGPVVRIGASLPDPVQSLLKELRSLKLHSTATNKQKTKQANLDPIPMQRRVSVRGEVTPSAASPSPTVPGAASQLSSHMPLGVWSTGRLCGRGAETQGRGAAGLAESGGSRALSPEASPITERQLLGRVSWGAQGWPFGLRRSDSQEQSRRLGGGAGRAGGGKGASEMDPCSGLSRWVGPFGRMRGDRPIPHPSCSQGQGRPCSRDRERRGSPEPSHLPCREPPIRLLAWLSPCREPGGGRGVGLPPAHFLLPAPFPSTLLLLLSGVVITSDKQPSVLSDKRGSRPWLV